MRARPDLDDAEIAIACASHLHRPDPLEPVQRLLTKADATEDDLEASSPVPRRTFSRYWTLSRKTPRAYAAHTMR